MPSPALQKIMLDYKYSYQNASGEREMDVYIAFHNKPSRTGYIMATV